MLIDEVIARIGASIPDLQGRTETATEMAVLMGEGRLPNVTPWAFVVPLGLDARPPANATGLHSQAVTETIGVVLIVDHAGDTTGGLAVPPVHALRDDIIAAIAGWQAASAEDTFRLVRARLLHMRASTLFYQIDFATLRHVRQP